MLVEVPSFQSFEEEAKFWKQKAEEFHKNAEDVKCELEEYQESSREVEAELEMQLKQAESQAKELRAANSRLSMENSTLKEKWEQLNAEHHSRLAELQKQLDESKKAAEEMIKYVRQLEQKNDDLERANRATLVSVEDFESRLHQAIERNAFLESELDDKESLVIMVQRLKDEAKELKQELQVRQRSIHESPDNDKSTAVESQIDATEKSDPTKSPVNNNNNKLAANTVNGRENGTGVILTQAARVSALNIVGDLLRRVGALETKLANCRAVSGDSNDATKDPARAKLAARASAASVHKIIRA